MIDVTCFHCGSIVQISPDAERCAKCGANLRRLIGGEQASGYFYHRAADMAGEGNVIAALQEVQRGLAYQPSSELNLLGAILCKRLGHLDQMRHYVAAIPADDALRGEAEWLLRSNQARQRAPVDPTKSGKAPVALPLVTDADALPMLMEEISPSVHHPRRPPPRRWVRPVLWLSLFTALAFGGWFIWQNPPAELLAALPGSGAGAATEQDPADGSAPSPVPATGAPAALPAPTLDLGTPPTPRQRRRQAHPLCASQRPRRRRTWSRVPWPQKRWLGLTPGLQWQQPTPSASTGQPISNRQGARIWPRWPWRRGWKGIASFWKAAWPAPSSAPSSSSWR